MNEPFFEYILVFSQQFSTGYVKDSDNTRAEATGEDLLTGMEGHTARAVLRHKVIQLFTEYKRECNSVVVQEMIYRKCNCVHDHY